MRSGIPFLISMAVLVFLLPNLCIALEYYVAPSGNNTNPGSIDAPFKTFRQAVSRAQAGDTIYARGGTYGFDNAMAYGVSANYSLGPNQTSCPEGESLGSGYCWSDSYAMIGLNDFDGWASRQPAYSAKDGNSSDAIVIRNYPGEHPVLDITDVRFGGRTGAAPYGTTSLYIRHKSYWTIQGLEIIGGRVIISGGTETQTTHDITIRDNDIHDMIPCDGTYNPGIIKVDVGIIGGPYNIFILNNELHGIYDWEFPYQWKGIYDMQHFGAVTVMSGEVYRGFNKGGTGLVEIKNNAIYHSPQAFFFKNPMAGPIIIENNTIHEVDSLGDMHPSNASFIHNLVYNVSRGFVIVGCANDASTPEMLSICGQNATVGNNTFVGPDILFSIWSGTGHSVKNNVFFGLNGRMSEYKGEFLHKSILYPDSLDATGSILQNISSDNNCFISPYSNFEFVMRELPASVTGTGAPKTEHYNYSQAGETFGYDANSRVIIQNNSRAIFADPANHDYRMINQSLCPNMGYYASETPGSPYSHRADTNEDSCVDNLELSTFIYQWKLNNLDVSIRELMEAIGLWKRGGCG
jgi:hypothetical protein